MLRYLIKPDPSKDLYLYWSTVSDSPLFAGNRKLTEATLLLHKIEEVKRDIGFMFDRVDSDKSCREGLVCDQKWLPARNLTALAERLSRDPEANFDDLLEEIEEDED